MRTHCSPVTSTENQRSGPHQLVFLVGPPRSGSTWLQAMLGSHPDIGTAQESHLFNHIIGPMINNWEKMLSFGDGRGGIGLPAYLTQQEFDALCVDLVSSVYSKVPEFQKPVFLEKTPDHILHLESIERLFPDARIIVLLRKPEDVIESLLNAGSSWGRHWAPKSTIRAIRQYQYFFRNNAESLVSRESKRIHVVRYEHLKDRPEKVLEQALEFLDLKFDKHLITNLIKSPHELKKYGEFGQRSGAAVVEPEGFARKTKGKLSMIQKVMINAALYRHRNTLGY